MEDVLRFEVDVPQWVLVTAEVFQAALVLACICTVIFVVLWLKDACSGPRVAGVPVDARRFPQSHRVLASPGLWTSTPGALFRGAGRRALSRVSQSELARVWRWVASVELFRRALLVEDIVRGRPSWLQLATPQAEVRRWVDVYLDSALPGLERGSKQERTEQDPSRSSRAASRDSWSIRHEPSERSHSPTLPRAGAPRLRSG